VKSSLKIKTIVVGVDFSKHSRAVVLQARTLAKKWKVPLVFVHGFEDPFVSEARFGDIIKHIGDHYSKDLHKFYKVEENEKVIVKCGRPFEQILAVSRKFSNSLIVIGHRGNTSFLSSLLLGSTAERVAQRSSSPVWIHRNRSVLASNKILVPCDLSDRAPYTVQFLKKNELGKTKLELFHVIEPPVPVLDYEAWQMMNKEAKRQSLDRLQKFKKTFPTLKIKEGWGETYIEIEKYSKHFDLIAISPRHKKGFWQGFGSITSKIARSSNKSLLIIP
jgi:nucleotide-binding universal stress UspA family protein